MIRHYLRLLFAFLRVSFQSVLAYRMNFYINVMYSLLNLVIGVSGVLVLFSQVHSLHGWNLATSLVLLGIYLVLGALRGIVIDPSLNGLVGMDGEIERGRFDFTLLRPANIQFLVSVRNWNLFALLDLLLGMGVLGTAIVQLHQAFAPIQVFMFLVAIISGVTVLYAISLAFSALVFWSPGFYFTWVFDGLFQMARYPIGFYPGWLRFMLTWIVPVGIMTTIPAQALSGELPPIVLGICCIVALAMFFSASWLFAYGVRRYASASS